MSSTVMDYSSSSSSGGNIIYALYKFGVSANGQLSLLGQKAIQPDENNLLAAPVVFSGDGLHIYWAIPGKKVSA